MENNTRHIPKKVKVKYGYIAIASLILMVGFWGLAQFSRPTNVDTQAVGYIRDVYKDDFSWYITFDDVEDNLDGDCGPGEDCLSDNDSLRNVLSNIEKFKLDDDIEFTTYNLADEKVVVSLSPSELAESLEAQGADFQATPFVVYLADEVVVSIEEVGILN